MYWTSTVHSSIIHYLRMKIIEMWFPSDQPWPVLLLSDVVNIPDVSEMFNLST